MNLCCSYRTVRQLNLCDTLPFPPAAVSVLFPKPRKFSYSGALGKSLRCLYLTDNPEVHSFLSKPRKNSRSRRLREPLYTICQGLVP